MESEDKKLPQEELSEEEVKIKSMWQIRKEGWYEKIPLNLKQLDLIIVISLVLLVITFAVIALDAMDIFNPFGY